MAAISELTTAWLMVDSGYLPLIIYLGIFSSSSAEQWDGMLKLYRIHLQRAKTTFHPVGHQ